MQIRKTIDQVAFALSVATLLGMTGAGLYFSYVHDGTLPPLGNEFSTEIDKLLKVGDHEGALLQMQRAANYNPNKRGHFLATRIRFAWSIGDVKRQRETMRQLADSGRVHDPDAYAHFALLLLKPNHQGAATTAAVDAETRDEAIAYANRALELDPNFALAHYDLGVAWMQQNDEQQAAACFRKALSLNPNLDAAKSDLARIERNFMTEGNGAQ